MTHCQIILASHARFGGRKMQIKILIGRVDGGCEPWEFVETRYDSVAIAREQTALAIAKFNDWADKSNQTRLKFSAVMIPDPDIAIAVPNQREAQRLAAQSQK